MPSSAACPSSVGRAGTSPKASPEMMRTELSHIVVRIDVCYKGLPDLIVGGCANSFPRLQDLAESAMENLRHSLGQKVLMLNPEEGLASGTTKHCISCFKDRSQSPVRGSIGNLVMW